MKLYLVRHGDYLSSDIDSRQPLSQTGKEETASVARYLEECGVEIDEILHSVKARSKETAEILGKRLAPDVALNEREGLKPLDPVEPIIEEIKLYERDLMIVGHLPFMEKLLTSLLFGDEGPSPVAFTGSCVVCLEGENSSWTISWIVSPALVRRSHV
ncbi:MAG: phosphohistidine phosphatase SixA [Chlamydiales bacterium]|nr:phosphohistidine phosphatase SixA [Chlamydiales bacterium]